MKLRPTPTVLVKVANAKAAQHRRAKEWLIGAYADPADVGLPGPR